MILINFWNPEVPMAKREAITNSILEGTFHFPGEQAGVGLDDDGHGDAKEDL